MTDYPQDFRKAVEFHGHTCPGLTIGYLAAKTALALLGVERATDEELVAIVESDGCGIDAIQVLLSCTIGKGNLIFRDHGKQAYTVGNRRTGKAVRLVMTGSMPALTPAQETIRSAVLGGRANSTEQAAWQEIQQERIARLMSTPAEQLFKVQDIALKLPSKAKLFDSVVCAYCGEKTMEARARLKNGKIACLACYEEYTRGW